MDRTVVYVVGKGRSGSTLLDDLLGTMPGVASLGELRLLWSRGLTPGYRCACGTPVAECPLWGSVVPAAVGAFDVAAMTATAELQHRVQRWSHLPARALGRIGPDDRAFGTTMARLYDAVADATGADVLVDSSKWPVPAGADGLVPGWDAKVLHLVRDPRAVAHSYRRRKGGDGQPELPRFGSVHTAASWSARNLAAEVGRRGVQSGAFRRLRYEDLATEPRPVLRSLGAWLGIEGGDAAFVDDVTVRLGEGHLVGGNPRRLDRSDLVVRPDDEWATREVGVVGRVADALTWPLRRRYGYAGAGGG